MKRLLAYSILLIQFAVNTAHAQGLDEEYISKWKAFYPSQALARGMHSAIYAYEDLSEDKIQEWLNFNRSILRQVSDTNLEYTYNNRVNARILRVQSQNEIDKWAKEAPHKNSLSLYSSLIANAVNRVLQADFLTASEKAQLLCQRLKDIDKIIANAKSSLVSVMKGDTERSLRRLRSTAEFLSGKMGNATKDIIPACDDYEQMQSAIASNIASLITHVENNLLPNAKTSSPIIGRAEYTRRLALYTDSDLTPEVLSKMALDEINETKRLMLGVSKDYLKATYPNRPLPDNDNALTRSALADMEKDAPLNAQDYLDFWLDLKDAAIQFIAEHKIATLPKNQTLQIKTAPESAGAAARIGWVASAPPFDPNPITTLFLPSIPETLPKQEQIDFWASFNKPFNRMIVIHELLPGHYMQMKISRETAHPIRLLFPYGTYTEGWATFTERVLLDAGWEKGQHLTMLAHLRKRLENANRAYTSVMVHTKGWSQNQVMDFSTNTSLVAAQFAKSLWGRLMRSPMQLTSYFLGGAQFTELLASEKARLGDQFNLTLFMDTIMKTGPIPIEEFNEIFAQTISKK